jgi:hypothetical protein
MSPATSPSSGRLAVLSAWAMAAGAVPIPLLPDRLIARVRGAVAHDVTSRHGLSLTSEARAVLASPSSRRGARALVRKATGIVVERVLRRLGPLGAIAPLSRGLEVYALGHLLERYFVQVRRTGAVRVHAEEARRVRAVIDRAVMRTLSPALQPNTTTQGTAVEDLRDEFTRWTDALLITGAAIPGYLERRLDSAFDESIDLNPDLRDE